MRKDLDAMTHKLHVNSYEEIRNSNEFIISFASVKLTFSRFKFFVDVRPECDPLGPSLYLAMVFHNPERKIIYKTGNS